MAIPWSWNVSIVIIMIMMSWWCLFLLNAPHISFFLSLRLCCCVCVYRYSELPDQQAFFDAAKKSQRIVAHFYRPSTKYCQILDAKMERLAPKHLETKVR